MDPCASLRAPRPDVGPESPPSGQEPHDVPSYTAGCKPVLPAWKGALGNGAGGG